MNTTRRYWAAKSFRYLIRYSSVLALLLACACGGHRTTDECCAYFQSPHSAEVKHGHGAVQVIGSTRAYYYILDKTGKQLAYKRLNEVVTLEPGRYSVKVNNSVHVIEVHAEKLTKCSTGTLMVSGKTTESYFVMDSVDQQLGYETLGRTMSLFPGNFRVKLNNTEAAVEVRLKELTEIRTGSLTVTGNTGEYYYVLDIFDKQLNYGTLESPLSFLPGTYVLKVNNTSRTADVFAGQVTRHATGNLLVKGLTEEYYYVNDTLGNALNYQKLNKPLAFFPGAFQIKVNNTLVEGVVLERKTTELVTGSLMLRGPGSAYYYVLDETGRQLNYNTLNRSLSFFPSEYIVKLGSTTRKASVVPGELTSISAFN